ncbi:uncharacterized protein ATC70_000345 [Mucor velutinosus]|uniref:Uncharacterized protein n=1 Tax=Mucor velutinosus TaxID=708070 RepID=A0AAN7DHE5_9FUNG|nr:hypothetical protein ATC70_000345 [Mucor velutinosus]
MNSVLSNTTFYSHHQASSASTDVLMHQNVTFSQMRPRYVDKCVAQNPRQTVLVDILGDMVELPVYALRRRNAMVHF